MKTLKTLNTKIVSLGQKFDATLRSPSQKQSQVLLFALGVALLVFGASGGVSAQGLTTTYNDTRLTDALNAILIYIEGAFGAMIMVVAGIGAILSSAMGQYRAAMGLLVVAVGAFILRSLIGTFFNDATIRA